MEITQERINAAYAVADDNIKKVLDALFCKQEEMQDNRPITERVKTFEDAVSILTEEHPFVVAYRCIEDIDECYNDIAAYFKLRIIVAALNEGWEPKFTEGEYRWYPWFTQWTKEELKGKSKEWMGERNISLFGGSADYGAYAGFGCLSAYCRPANTTALIGARLCLESKELAEYCGKQFKQIWATYLLGKNVQFEEK